MTKREQIFTSYIKAQTELRKWLEENADYVSTDYCEGVVLSYVDEETGEIIDIMSDHCDPISNSIHVGFFCCECEEYTEVADYASCK